MALNKLILLNVAVAIAAQPNCESDSQFRSYYFSIKYCNKFNCFDDEFAQFITSNIQMVHIRDAKIIPTCAFSNAHHLKYVEGVNRNVEVIAHNAFVNLPKMEVVSLPFNFVKELHRGVFNNVTLTSLDLSWNKLVYVQEGAFEGINGLKHLNLSGNELFSLPFQHFSPSLLSLNVSHNSFKSVILFYARFPNLTAIDFSDNELEKVALNFEKTIEELDLSRNRLQDIDLFEVNHCERLKIRRNNFSSVPHFLTYSSIKRLSLHPNPWKCSELKKLWIYLQNNRISVDDTNAREEEPICSESHELKIGNIVDQRYCRDDVHCNSKELCRQNRCMNPCKANACDFGTVCVAKNHQFKCQCPGDQRRDPREMYAACGDYDCFFHSDCGPEEICDTVDNRCKFIPSEPTDLENNNVQPLTQPEEHELVSLLPWWYDEIPLLPRSLNRSNGVLQDGSMHISDLLVIQNGND